MTNELTEQEVQKIKEQAKEKLGLCRKSHDIIGTQIFSIIGLYARVVYYPLGAEGPWGFTRLRGTYTQGVQEKPFVVINSSIPEDCQVFAAAHELYHIWYQRTPEVLSADLLEESGANINEKKANRFAAEFLVDEQLLKQEIDLRQITKFDLKAVLQLAHLFTVPYRTMAKRLAEIGSISDEELTHFLSVSEISVGQYRKRYAIPVPPLEERIVLDDLVELSLAAYEQNYITYEKLEYLLDLCQLTPQDVGVEVQEDYKFPTDEELERIMEE